MLGDGRAARAGLRLHRRFRLSRARVARVAVARGALRRDRAHDGRRVDEPGLKEKYLETALPKDGGPVYAVLGPRKHQRGVLLARDRSPLAARHAARPYVPLLA